MKTELWSSEEMDDVKTVEETLSDGGARQGQTEQWHFQNALFQDLSRASSTKPSKTTSNNSMSRRRYSCLACGEIKRWDQLTQHYKKFVQFDSLGIPCVPDQKQMSDKVYQHTAIFFEKNFSRDRMPQYKDHVPGDCLLSGGEERPALPALPDLSLVQHKELSGQRSLFFSPPFPLQPASTTLKMPPLILPHSAAGRGSRKRKLAAGGGNSSSGLNQSQSINSPSQSRRFYKCLGCGAAKRWDRLTDHYRKYVVFGSLGHPMIPSLDTMTAEQYVHTMAFRDQAFSADRMPQYKDHSEANQDNEEEFSFTDDSITKTQIESEHCKDLSVHFSSPDHFITNEGSEAHIQSSQSSAKQPNMEDFWEKKTFSDCKILCQGGRVIETHRLILAAHNDFFYQLLVNTGDSDTSVIIMPDHSFEEISAIVEQLYNFKVKETAFIFKEEQNELKTSENSTNNCKLEKKKSAKVTLDPFQLSTSAKRKRHLETEKTCKESPENNIETQSNSDLSTEDCPINPVERFIMKTGGILSPTYSCKVSGCKFSVKKSLLCIKGHILAEHWASLLCSNKQA